MVDAFNELESKYAKQMSVMALNSKLAEEHLLPMLVIQDQQSGDLLAQIFSFIDYMGQKQNINALSKSLRKSNSLRC